MSNFWPSGLDLNDTASPLEILKLAQEEWVKNSGGLLSLIIQEAESTAGNEMLIVHAKHIPSNRTIALFSIIHRRSAPYPARIQPRDIELPDTLKKSYYQPGFGDLTVPSLRTEGRQVVNKWVCDSPSEFRRELRNVFDLGFVKSEVLSLVSGPVMPSPVVDEAKKDEKVEGDNANR